ncbi:MAG: nucleotidyl transferase AbiEii/AbiGii toxin family protein [Acidobacteriota bacterium]
MVDLFRALEQVRADFDALERPWALVGGLAVSLRAEPRTTQDIDIAVAADSDDVADIVRFLWRARGYQLTGAVEHGQTGHVSTVRFRSPQRAGGALVDVLMASSGIESEIVAASELLEVLPSLTLPVATLGHLLAVKLLAGRAQDDADIERLVHGAEESDIAVTRVAITLIVDRGFHRDKDLHSRLDTFLRRRIDP